MTLKYSSSEEKANFNKILKVVDYVNHHHGARAFLNSDNKISKLPVGSIHYSIGNVISDSLLIRLSVPEIVFSFSDFYSKKGDFDTSLFDSDFSVFKKSVFELEKLSNSWEVYSVPVSVLSKYDQLMKSVYLIEKVEAELDLCTLSGEQFPEGLISKPKNMLIDLQEDLNYVVGEILSNKKIPLRYVPSDSELEHTSKTADLEYKLNFIKNTYETLKVSNYFNKNLKVKKVINSIDSFSSKVNSEILEDLGGVFSSEFKESFKPKNLKKIDDGKSYSYGGFEPDFNLDGLFKF